MTLLATTALWSKIATAQATDTSEVRRQLERPYAATQSHKGFVPIVNEWSQFIRQVEQPGPMHTINAELAALTQQFDLDGADMPTPLTIETARTIIERSFALGISPARVLASAEGGVFIAFVQHDHMANIEIFNEGQTFAATHRGGLNVWPISTQDIADIDAALERIREQLAN